MESPSRSPDEPRGELHIPRDEEEASNADHLAATLRQRGAAPTGTESADELATLLSAVERFEAARAALGGDSFTNSPTSSRPESRDFVLPRRTDDDTAESYTERILRAAEELEARGG